MIRRIILIAAAAVALIFVPSVAMAYNAPGYSSSVSDSTPVAGHPITVTVNGLPGEMIKLVVTSPSGVQTYSKRANANGRVKFTFQTGAAGITTIQAFNAAGKMVSDQTIKVLGAGAASSSGNAGVGSGNPSAFAGTGLASTGFDGIGLAVGGGALVVVGAGAVVVAKRRRSAQTPA